MACRLSELQDTNIDKTLSPLTLVMVDSPFCSTHILDERSLEADDPNEMAFNLAKAMLPNCDIAALQNTVLSSELSALSEHLADSCCDAITKKLFQLAASRVALFAIDVGVDYTRRQFEQFRNESEPEPLGRDLMSFLEKAVGASALAECRENALYHLVEDVSVTLRESGASCSMHSALNLTT